MMVIFMKSIWDENLSPFSINNSFNQNIQTTVCIIGGGITGISLAYFLHQENIDTILLEKNTINQKTTHFSSAKITSQHGLIYSNLIKQYGKNFAKQYLHANQEAIQKIKSIIEKEKINCDFKVQDAYLFTENLLQANTLKKEYQALLSLQFKDAKLVEGIPIALSSCSALKFLNQAQFNPVKYTLSLAKILNKNCHNIYENITINQIKKINNKYILFTDKGTISAKYVVLATHYPIKDFPGFYFTKMYQDTSYLLAFDIGKKEENGMYLSIDEPNISVRFYEQNNTTFLLLGGYHHKTGTIPIKNPYLELQKIAFKMYPNAKLVAKWSTQDCMTLDNVPYIGNFSNYMKNFFVATGYNKWGMTSSHVAAKILTDLILNRSNPYQKIFRATRYHPIKNIKQVYHMSSQTIQSMFLNKYKIKKATIEAIPKDTGRIIKYQHISLGVYRDPNGKAHIINPYCAHLKCLLTFNPIDRTWDCPCHGSKFDIDGNVIYSPSSKNLE